MLWWFEQQERRTLIEVLYLPAGGFERRIKDRNGDEHSELFADLSDLLRRQQALQDALLANGWRAAGAWLE